MKDGVYFNMPFDEYLKIEALSSSGIRDLLESPTKFWFNSNFNFLREEKKSPALNAGTLFHAAILENGLSSYIYEKNDLNRNSNAYKEWASAQTKQVIGKAEYMQVENILRYYRASGALNIFETEGYSEVTIVWTEADGIRRKARIDRLTEWGFIDLKTFLKQKSGSFDEYVNAYFYRYKVHIQLKWYQRALEYAHSLPTKGTQVQKDFFGRLTAKEIFLPSVMFLDRETPHAIFKVFSEQYCPELYRLANDKIEQATDVYKKFMDELGAKKAWIVDVAQSTFSDNDFPMIMRDILDKGEL